MRNERRKRIQLNPDRKARIFELKMRQRILRRKFGRRDAAQSGRIVRAQAVLAFIGRQICALPARASSVWRSLP